MIHEYALDPALVAIWARMPSEYRFFGGKFGIGNRRVASAFPSRRDWSRLTVQAVETAIQGTPEAQRQTVLKKAEALVNLLVNSGMAARRDTPSKTAVDWRRDVLAEHDSHPFQAILTCEPPSIPPQMLDASQLDEQTSSAWLPPSVQPVRSRRPRPCVLRSSPYCAVRARFDSSTRTSAPMFTNFVNPWSGSSGRPAIVVIRRQSYSRSSRSSGRGRPRTTPEAFRIQANGPPSATRRTWSSATVSGSFFHCSIQARNAASCLGAGISRSRLTIDRLDQY